MISRRLISNWSLLRPRPVLLVPANKAIRSTVGVRVRLAGTLHETRRNNADEQDRISQAVAQSASASNERDFVSSFFRHLVASGASSMVKATPSEILEKYSSSLPLIESSRLLLTSAIGDGSVHVASAIKSLQTYVDSKPAIDSLRGVLYLLKGRSQDNVTQVICSCLDQAKEDDEICTSGLDLLVGCAATSSDKNVINQIIDTVMKVLEVRRSRRENATVQQLQKNEWTDLPVFESAERCLDACARIANDPLSRTRTPYGRARRLLLFAPSSNPVHNVKTYIASMAQRDLLVNENDHPLAMLGAVARSAFPDFHHFGPNVNPVVTTKQCFDDLLVPPDHVSRRPSDTFYLSDNMILRAHTSAHQTEFLSKGYMQFLVSGDVYRRDEIDKTHFPVFHQMEGVKVLPLGSTEKDAFEDLKANLNRLADLLFPGQPRKWIDAYFPFTHPSLELEIDYKGKSVELLGCGVVQPAILKQCGLEGRVAWAFGLGLERLAMILFQIPDIRLFWTEDKRFLDQFVGCRDRFVNKGKVTKFKAFSKYPPSKRDVSFWLPQGQATFHVNDFFSIVREIAGDNVEEVEQVDSFIAPDGRASKAFRIIFRSDFRTLSGQEVNAMVANIVARLEGDFKVTVR